MADLYANFEELKKAEKEGVAYAITRKKREAGLVVVAPHGGNIEPGTSEIARAVAGSRYSWYCFEGIKKSGNGSLHLTSTHFDEPAAIKLIRASRHVVTIHGRKADRSCIYVGGRESLRLRTNLCRMLRRYGFNAQIDAKFPARDKRNLCNRSKTGKGLQLELSRGLRRTLFQSLAENKRHSPTVRFRKLVRAVRLALRASYFSSR